MNLKKALFGFALVMSTSAMAQESKWYLGGELGAAKVDNDTVATAQGFVSQFGGSAVATQSSSVGVARVFAGYKLNQIIDLEIGYFQSGDVSSRVNGVSGAGVPYVAGIDVDFKGFDYSVLLRPFYGSSEGKGLFVRLGGHNSKAESQVYLAGGGAAAAAGGKESGNGFVYGLGYDLEFGKSLFGRAAVTRYNKLAGIADNDGTVYSVGLGVKF